MNKRGGLIISAAIIIIALIIGFSFGLSFGSDKEKIEELELDLQQKDARISTLENQIVDLQNPSEEFTCRVQEILDCMPPIAIENQNYCSGQYLIWISENCDIAIVF